MFRDFYRMADELHKAVEPFRYSVALSDLAKSYSEFGKAIGAAVIESLRVALSLKRIDTN
jgi:hypothetical protein